MWLRLDNEISFTAKDVEALPKIPVGNWLVKFDPQKGFFLEKAAPFKLPKKIYGDAEGMALRILNTFKNKNSNLGALLSGLKGTGKSVTAKIVSVKSEIPVILVSEPFVGDGFKSLLSNITQEVVIFIDEFEKIYNKTELQDSVLSILDGVFEGKKLFLITSNEKGRINQYMINRPGRIHYLKEYESLDQSTIDEAIEDMLDNKSHIDGLKEVLNIIGSVTMDVLVSLIFEMNLYKEDARQAVKLLNLRPESIPYEVEIFQDKISIGKTRIANHPLTNEFLSFNITIPNMEFYKRGAANHASLISSYTAAKETQDKHKRTDMYSLIANFNVDIKKSEITQDGTTISIRDVDGSEFVFTKLVPYNFNF